MKPPTGHISSSHQTRRPDAKIIERQIKVRGGAITYLVGRERGKSQAPVARMICARFARKSALSVEPLLEHLGALNLKASTGSSLAAKAARRTANECCVGAKHPRTMS